MWAADIHHAVPSFGQVIIQPEPINGVFAVSSKYASIWPDH